MQYKMMTVTEIDGDNYLVSVPTHLRTHDEEAECIRLLDEALGKMKNGGWASLPVETTVERLGPILRRTPPLT